MSPSSMQQRVVQLRAEAGRRPVRAARPDASACRRRRSARGTCCGPARPARRSGSSPRRRRVSRSLVRAASFSSRLRASAAGSCLFRLHRAVREHDVRARAELRPAARSAPRRRARTARRAPRPCRCAISSSSSSSRVRSRRRGTRGSGPPRRALISLLELLQRLDAASAAGKCCVEVAAHELRDHEAAVEVAAVARARRVADRAPRAPVARQRLARRGGAVEDRDDPVLDRGRRADAVIGPAEGAERPLVGGLVGALLVAADARRGEVVEPALATCPCADSFRLRWIANPRRSGSSASAVQTRSASSLFTETRSVVFMRSAEPSAAAVSGQRRYTERRTPSSRRWRSTGSRLEAGRASASGCRSRTTPRRRSSCSSAAGPSSPGERYRFRSEPGIRITATTLEPAEGERLAADLADILGSGSGTFAG